MVAYFWDSYAIVESIDGNKNYEKFSNEPIIMTIFNLAEVYWFALHEYGEEKGDEIYERFKKCVIDIDFETLKEAVKYRKKNKKKDISYADAIGYTYALMHDLIFLTGDKAFQNINNVEFVQ